MRFYVIIILFFYTTLSFTQSYLFKNFSVAEGLAQTQVTSIVEDNNGYLWVGTLGGLSRFNGSEFKNFSSDDGLVNNRITSLFKNKNDLWIGHESGISCFRNNKLKSWEIDKNNVSISDFIVYKNQIIASSIGEGLYVITNDKLTQIKLNESDQNFIRKMDKIGDKLYFATRAGLYYTKDLKSFLPVKYKNEINVTTLKAKDTFLYFTTIEGEVVCYDTKKRIFKTIYDFNSVLFTKSLFVKNDQIFCVNPIGLSIINDGKVETINENNGLTLNALNQVFEDRNGTFWIGSDGKGLFRFAGTQIKYFNKKNGISSDLVTASYQSKNKLIFGSYDNGLIFYQNSIFENLQLPNNTVWAVNSDNLNNIWVGTQNGLFKINEKKIENFATNFKINSFYKENEKMLWVGGSNGLHKIENGTYLFNNKQDFNLGTIRAIVRHNNKIYCGTDKGLYSYHRNKFTLIENFKKRISSLVVDEFNNLWIGTDEGLYKLHNNKLYSIKISLESASKVINFLNRKQNDLFVGTNNGVYVINTRNPQKIEHFGMDEGLVTLETNINSSFFDKKENFWFGTADGLVLMELDKISFSEPIPFLNIGNIKVNFQELDKKLVQSIIGHKEVLNLPFNKNNIIIELDGVLLKKYASLNYKYWLEGLDDNWSPNFTNPIINLSNLPSGDYILHIKASNNNGIFSNESRIKFSISPVFYKTWWFILFLIFIILFVIYAIFRYRINREKQERYQENLEYKSKLLTLEQQTLNASMNRHFIFNSLNSIQYFINTQDKLAANKFLSNFAKLIRKNLDSSAEDGGLVTLQEEIERIQLYLSLEEMRFKNRFVFEINLDKNVDLENIKIPSMLIQPFVENSIIHGILPQQDKKGKIRIEIIQVDNIIEITIDDNGVGIENSLKSKNLSSGDHKSQGMEITNKRLDILNKFKLNTYNIIGPFQLEENNHSIKGTRVLIKIMLKNLENEN